MNHKDRPGSFEFGYGEDDGGTGKSDDDGIENRKKLSCSPKSLKRKGRRRKRGTHHHTSERKDKGGSFRGRCIKGKRGGRGGEERI